MSYTNKSFDYIKTIYTKKNSLNLGISNSDSSLPILLSRWLSYDQDNLPYLKKISPYMFYLNPKHYFYLLYFGISKKPSVPYLKTSKKEKVTEDKLKETIKEFLGWGEREWRINENTLNSVILKDRKYWEKEFGLE